MLTFWSSRFVGWENEVCLLECALMYVFISVSKLSSDVLASERVHTSRYHTRLTQLRWKACSICECVIFLSWRCPRTANDAHSKFGHGPMGVLGATAVVFVHAALLFVHVSLFQWFRGNVLLVLVDSVSCCLIVSRLRGSTTPHT